MTTDADGMSAQERFHSWYGEHRGILVKVARSFAADSDEQDDLFQEILLQVWKSIPHYDGTAKPSTWIYRVALNRAISWARLQQRWKRDHLVDVSEVYIVQSDRDERLLLRLYEEIRALSEVERSLALMLLDGMSYADMSDILGISVSNVGVRIHRLKKRLSERLEGEK